MNAPHPRPEAAGPRESGDEIVAQEVARSVSTLGAWALRGVLVLAGGGGAAAVGVGASSAAASTASRQLEALDKKLDHLGEDQEKSLREGRETRALLDAFRSDVAVRSAREDERARAQRHEERLLDLEKLAQQSVLERAQLRLELEAIKKAR